MILPGPHVFIIVLNLGQRFTQEEATTVKIIQETFGEHSLVFIMVLFSRGDYLKNKTIDQCLGKPGSSLMNFMEACGNRYHVFNNNNQTGDRTQVSDLLEKIDAMVEANGGCFYSCKMFVYTFVYLYSLYVHMVKLYLSVFERLLSVFNVNCMHQGSESDAISILCMYVLYMWKNWQ